MQVIPVVNDATTRERLSGPAIRGFLRLADAWNLSAQEKSDLLGASVSRGTLRNWAQDESASTLNADQLMRVSLLLGIYEGLQRIWRRVPADADAWLRRARQENPFQGQNPLQYMRDGGIVALVGTRAYVDGATGGPPSRADYAQPPREEI